MTLEERLMLHEGVQLKPYRDTAGQLTIGVGRNLDDTGLSREEALLLLRNDVARCWDDARRTWPWLHEHLRLRQEVLVEMVFNLGLRGVLGFRRMLTALEAHDYEGAAREMLDSRWAEQVGDRALRLAAIMRTGREEATA